MGQVQSVVYSHFRDWSLPWFQSTSAEAEEEKELGLFLRPLLSSFIAELGYHGPCATKNEKFWEALHLAAAATGVAHAEDTPSYRCLKLGGYYGLVCFPNHPTEVQVHIGIYTWLATLMDNPADETLPDMECFHQRFVTGEPQPTLHLERWAENLRSTFNYWDPLVASMIVASSINFTNACVLEARLETGRMVPTKGGQQWPWYLREKSGIGDAYAYFAFPKALCPDVLSFMEAIADLSAFICLTNDILSFYKEEKACDSNNYIHNTARYEGKHARIVLKDTIMQVKAAVDRTRVVMKGKGPYEQVLNDYIVGYIGFHLKNGRYKLGEIGLGDASEGE
ncbi:hypothetical protein M426DRAFT_64080 [Hypoxylon sp. CI-4A]|nr:hypothetical protein M426DRAFT_64080 [Hypoxylon sp. CI-4A]